MIGLTTATNSFNKSNSYASLIFNELATESFTYCFEMLVLAHNWSY